MSPLRALYAPFDESALAALASKGLARRAARDVAAGKAAFDGPPGAESVIILVDGARVRLDLGGPEKAQCDCSAPGLCRHVLAAILLLRAEAMAESGEAAASAEPAAPSPDQGAIAAEILAIEPKAIRAYAGKPALRAALQMLESSIAPRLSLDGGLLLIEFGLDAAPTAVRYAPGLGPDGVISKAPNAKKKALHAAALIAVRRMGGLSDFDDLDADRPARRGAGAAGPQPLDPAFLAAIAARLEDVSASALNQAPEAVEDALFALSVSSRADASPRLARMLRAVAADLARKRARDPTHEPAAALGLIAAAWTFARALAAGAAEDQSEARLALPDLTLIGLGAELWSTPAGARGATAVFYAPETDGWWTGTLARGTQHDMSFDPAAAYASQSVWGDCSLADWAARRFVLSAGTGSADRRLGLQRTASTRDLGPLKPEADGLFARAETRWAALESGLQGVEISLVDPPESAFVLLAPSQTGEAFLDALAQEAVWPVADENGRWIGLRGPASGPLARSLARWTPQRWRERRRLILVKAFRRPDASGLRPIAVISEPARPDAPAAEILESLDFGDRTASGRHAPSYRGPRLAERAGFLADADLGWSARLLAEIDDALVGLAETGGAPMPAASAANVAPPDAVRRLERLAQSAEAGGLSVFADALSAIRAGAGPAALLQTVRLARIARSVAAPAPWLRPLS